MQLHRWWQGDPLERYWLEITNRPDLGTDLHAPRRDESGNETWTYALVRDVQDGDIVFHYEKERNGITAWSRAYGGFWEDETVWGTPRSTGPTGSPVTPYLREGLWHGLHGPFYLEEMLTLSELRGMESKISRILGELERQHGKPLYLPFQIRSDGLRGAQGYLTKMPAALVEALPKLPDLLDDQPVAVFPAPPRRERKPGQPYGIVDLAISQRERDPFSVDPAAIERSLRSHGALQNMLAERVADLGYEPRSPGPLDPPWDLLWLDGSGSAWVTEVKSLTRGNEERQLRLGLGQLLIYRQRLQHVFATVKPALMVEWQPPDPDWRDLCAELGVLLLWPQSISAIS